MGKRAGRRQRGRERGLRQVARVKQFAIATARPGIRLTFTFDVPEGFRETLAQVARNVEGLERSREVAERLRDTGALRPSFSYGTVRVFRRTDDPSGLYSRETVTTMPDGRQITVTDTYRNGVLVQRQSIDEDPPPILGFSTEELRASLQNFGNAGVTADEAMQFLRLFSNPDPERPKPSPCNGCANFHGKGYGRDVLHCAMHPYGPEGETCEDWEESKPKPETIRFVTPHLQYTLEGRNPVPCENSAVWGEWFRTADRCVAETMVRDARVSTVFLGIDHSFEFSGPPILFETMVFGGVYDELQHRCSTWEEAEQGHERIVRMVRLGTLPA